MKRIQMVGAFLWRGGAVVAVLAGLVESARWVLRLIEVPRELQLGLGLLMSGFFLLVASLIAERIKDYRAESDLSE